MTIMIVGAGGIIGKPLTEYFLSVLGVEVDYLIAVDREGVTPVFTPSSNAEWIEKNLEEATGNWWADNVTAKEVDRIYYLECFENKNIYSPYWEDVDTLILTDFYFLKFLHERDTTSKELTLAYISTDKIYYGDEFPDERSDIKLQSYLTDQRVLNPYDDPNRRPYYSYAAFKAHSEISLQIFNELDNLRLLIIRPFSLVHQKCGDDHPIVNYVQKAIDDNTFHLFEEGRQGVAFTHVNDLVRFLRNGYLFNPQYTSKLESPIINFCRAWNYLSVRQLTEKIINKTESSSTILDDNPLNDFAEVMKTPQIRNMVAIYRPIIPIETILEEIIYEQDPTNHYMPLVANDPVITGDNVTMAGTVHPLSVVVVDFGNGDTWTIDSTDQGDWSMMQVTAWSYMYPIIIKATTQDRIQYATVVIEDPNS
jgi:nucleoside-diphosphate-sugar epimerase